MRTRVALLLGLVAACGGTASSALDTDGGADGGSADGSMLGQAPTNDAAAGDAEPPGPDGGTDAAILDAGGGQDSSPPVDAGIDAAGELASYCAVQNGPTGPLVRECDPSVTVHCTTDAGAVVWSCTQGTLNPCPDFALCCVSDGMGGNYCTGHTTHLCAQGGDCVPFPGQSCQFDSNLDAGASGKTCVAPPGAP